MQTHISPIILLTSYMVWLQLHFMLTMLPTIYISIVKSNVLHIFSLHYIFIIVLKVYKNICEKFVKT